jgi:WD40 repeat protein
MSVTTSAPLKKVFLSYGTGDALDVAAWLYGALSARGHEVFWDREGLKKATGSEWERHLEAAILSHDVVVALLSPHSVRPEGECRNEISFAKDNRKPIVPVMVRRCERPLRVHDLQYIDMESFGRVSESDRAKWIDEIVRCIEEGAPSDPVVESLRRRFHTLDYGRILKRHAKHRFMGREWLFDRIDVWAADPNGPSTLFVTGGPGVGKTSAMAHWCEHRLGIGAYHFCDFHEMVNARKVVGSLASQLLSLSSVHPSYAEVLNVLRERLPDEGATSSRDWSPVEWLRYLVLNPLRNEPPSRPFVLVVDALDEASGEVLEMFHIGHSELPPGVKLLATSRPERALASWFRGAVVIDAASEENRADLRLYVTERLNALPESSAAASDGVPHFLERVLEASEGSFLYCSEVLNAVETRHILVSDEAVLPDGIGGVYEKFLKRRFPDAEGAKYSELRKVLEVVLGARELVDDRFVSEVSGLDVYDVEDLRASLGTLLASGTEWRFFHKSFADWLGDANRSDYGVRAGRGGSRILRCLGHGNPVLRDYEMRWHVQHLIDEGKLEKACTLLTDFSVLKSRVEAGLVRGVLEDMDALIRAASGAAWPVPETLRVWQRLFRRRREFWEQFPEEFHQDCLNEAEGLPTTESAKANPIDKPWIRWVNKPEHEIRHPWEWMVRDASCAAFSPDGKIVAVGGMDGSLRLIDAGTGYVTWQIKVHEKLVTSAVFSPDGARVLTVGWDREVSLWDASTGAELSVLHGHESNVISAEFSPDGARVLTASGDKTARIWDATTGSELYVLHGHEDSLTSAVFSPDGARVLTASGDATARVWEVSTAAVLYLLRGHGGVLSSAVFSPDGALVLTASNDMTARVWDTTSGAELLVLRGHDHWVCSAVFSPDAVRVLTASNDKTVRIWNASTGVELSVLRGHESCVQSAQFSPDGKFVLTGPDGKINIFALNDGSARVWDSSTGFDMSVLRGHENPVRSAEFSPDGSLVLTASKDKAARLWDVATGSEISVLRGHEREVTSAVFSLDGSRVLTAAEDKTVRVWDASTGSALSVLLWHKGSVRSAVFSQDGARVLILSRDRTARIWGASTGAELLVLSGHESWVNSAVFSPDGARVLTSGDITARLWDASTGSELSVLRGHEYAVKSAVFSPDDTRVLTASRDKTARLWDASTGLDLLVLSGHEDDVRSAVFSPDGARVLTASRDNTARLWDASTGESIGDPICNFTAIVSTQDMQAAVSLVSQREVLHRWSDGSPIPDSDPPVECPSRPTLIGSQGNLRHCLRVRGLSGFVPPWIHIDSPSVNDCVKVLPNDPLSFVAGCADGSVRFFRLEGVELPVMR